MDGESYVIRKVAPAILIAIILAGFGAAVQPAHAQAEDRTSVLLLLAPDHSHAAGIAEMEDMIASLGGQVTHTFPYQALIAQVPPELIRHLASLKGVENVFTEAVDPTTLDAYSADAQRLIAVWNALIAPPAAREPTAASAADLANDTLTAPDLPVRDQLGAAGATATPGYFETSEFMTGSVAVGVVLVESDGSVDRSTENWTASEKQLVFNKIVAAFNWWAALEPRANLRFVYDDHWSNPLPTGVEPISRPYYDEQRWIADTMGRLGYRDPSYFTRVRDYNSHLRSTYATDWAVTIFVVDSSADSDGRFSDGMFAYAYVGGPFMVLGYGNDGYGPDNLDAIAAHEIGHLFLALDQYSAAQQPCTRQGGYLGVENQNSVYGGCSSNATSIMRGNTTPYRQGAVDRYARGQIGWRDSDGDGVLDPLDTDLAVTISSATQDNDRVSITGMASSIPYPSPTRVSVTINTVARVQYRVDGGAWLAASAADGKFDTATEGYRLTTASLPPGLRRIEVAAFDSAGNAARSLATHTVAVLDPVDGGLTTELQPPAAASSASGPVTVGGVAYQLQHGTVASVEYRLDGDVWQPASAMDGAFDGNAEPFSLTFSEPLALGTHLVEARATDSMGTVEVNVARYALDIRQFSVALPIVTRAR